MARRLNVFFLPAEFSPEDVAGDVAVVVDILRASTTITHALANGVDCVIPCSTIEEATAVKQQDEPHRCLLGGERGGVRIEGFDLGNSPTAYAGEVVKGMTVAFTTTNGTRALLRSSQAKEVMVGAFVNLTTVVRRIQSTANSVQIVCAGTDGQITGEDVLFAGALVERLTKKETDHFELTDAAEIARDHYRVRCPEQSVAQIEAAMIGSRGGRNLVRLGYEADIRTAANVDSVPVVGIVDDDGSIRIAKP